MIELGPALRAARRRAGLTQAAVAARAETSQSAIAAYEGGRKAPNLATLERIARATQASLRVELQPGDGHEHRPRPVLALSLEERRSLWLYRAIAARIQQDPEHARHVAEENLATMRRANDLGRGEHWRTAWEDLLERPLEELLAVLCATTTYAAQLRQTAPFAGLLTPRERWAVYGSFAKAEGEARPA
ncbi:MAG: helix-turn-helix transcriptional regulator [Actinomycetota bacterium]|nr:helix-turn-helix transcriptional regulator [Actinomycetota bacterium]